MWPFWPFWPWNIKILDPLNFCYQMITKSKENYHFSILWFSSLQNDLFNLCLKIFLLNKPIKRINVAFSIVWGNCHVLWYIQLLRESRGLFELPCSGGAHNYSQTLRKILYCRIVEENWNIFNLSSPRLLFRRRRRLEVSQTKHQKSHRIRPPGKKSQQKGQYTPKKYLTHICK